MRFIRGTAPDLKSHMQIPCKVNAFLCSIVRSCWRLRVAIAMLNNFKQLILPTQLNRVGWVVESEIIIFSTTKFISNAFIKCVLMSQWILPRPAKHRASVTYNLVQQCSKAGTFKWSDDSWETRHKMIEMLVKNWFDNDNCHVVCPFRRDKNLNFDSVFCSQTSL